VNIWPEIGSVGKQEKIGVGRKQKHLGNNKKRSKSFSKVDQGRSKGADNGNPVRNGKLGSPGMRLVEK